MQQSVSYLGNSNVPFPFDISILSNQTQRRESLLVLADNAIPIKSWFNDPWDTALLNLLPVLDALRFVTDVRSVLSRNRQAHS